MNKPTPWPALLRAALSIGLSPWRFWQLSLREWRALTSSEAGAMSLANLIALAARFPDETR